jgi:CubicO group peptidase (beta-lactamase class C family)
MSNYFLLGMTIEEVTDKKAGEVIKRRICDRPGMSGSYMSESEYIDGAHSLCCSSDSKRRRRARKKSARFFRNKRHALRLKAWNSA